MSGGRATFAQKKGKILAHHAGDITSTAPEGHALTAKMFIESKFYKKLDIEAFVLTGKGTLGGFWKVALREAKAHNREPLLIVRQNRTEELVVVRPNTLSKIIAQKPKGMVLRIKNAGVTAEVRYLSDVLACPFRG